MCTIYSTSLVWSIICLISFARMWTHTSTVVCFSWEGLKLLKSSENYVKSTWSQEVYWYFHGVLRGNISQHFKKYFRSELYIWQIFTSNVWYTRQFFPGRALHILISAADTIYPSSNWEHQPRHDKNILCAGIW